MRTDLKLSKNGERIKARILAYSKEHPEASQAEVIESFPAGGRGYARIVLEALLNGQIRNVVFIESQLEGCMWEGCGITDPDMLSIDHIPPSRLYTQRLCRNHHEKVEKMRTRGETFTVGRVSLFEKELI